MFPVNALSKHWRSLSNIPPSVARPSFRFLLHRKAGTLTLMQKSLVKYSKIENDVMAGFTYGPIRKSKH